MPQADKSIKRHRQTTTETINFPRLKMREQLEWAAFSVSKTTTTHSTRNTRPWFVVMVTPKGVGIGRKNSLFFPPDEFLPTSVTLPSGLPKAI